MIKNINIKNKILIHLNFLYLLNKNFFLILFIISYANSDNIYLSYNLHYNYM